MLNMGTNVERVASRSDAGTVNHVAIAVLRNRRLGLWAACMMEMAPFAADAYADEIVALGLQRNGEKEIIDRIVADFRKHGVDVTPEALCIEAARFTPRLKWAATLREPLRNAA